ncbi:MAG TPA: M42 family metallopeptidase [bacterium]|nr:M42 family metallopeptidase [bacterium]
MLDKKSLAFLEKFVNTPSPSGFERPAQQVWRSYVTQFADKVESDVQGNAVGVLNRTGKPRVMLIGHCDEVGFMVKYVNDQGFIYFGSIGGVDPNIVPAKRVIISTAKGPVKGVIGRTAIHLQDREDEKKTLKLHEMWIDIGAKNKEETLKRVAIGDPVVFDLGFEILSGDLAVARGFDDKMGAFVVAEALRLLAHEKKLQAAVFGVSSVQEEISFAGALTSAFHIEPSVAIAVDVGNATDTPGISKERHGEVKLGLGPIIDRGSSVSPRVEEALMKVARAKKIPFQVSAAPRWTGTDADAVFKSRGGVACGLLSVPNRYMHTPVEVIHLGDLEQCARLMAAFVLELDKQSNFSR